MKWTWQVGDARVVANMNAWTGARSVEIDDRSVAKTQGGLRARFEDSIADEPAVVDVGLRYAVMPHATLTVGGREIEPESGPHPLPAWAWLFFAACVFILIDARGGAIPGALAGGGAVGCLYAAVGGPASPALRIALCAGITAACWGGYLALVAALT